MDNPGIFDGMESYISKFEFDPKSTSKLIFWGASGELLLEKVEKVENAQRVAKESILDSCMGPESSPAK